MTQQQQLTNATDASSEDVAENGETAADSSPAGDTEVLYQTRPTIKPPIVWVFVTVLVGGVLALASFANVYGLEDPELAAIVGWATVFVVVAIVLRILVRIYVLTRTTYALTETGIRHEFSLWFRHRSREIPFNRVRGQQFQQDRIQRVFRVGTISVLTGGTNASLGFVELHNVPNPDEISEIVRNQRQTASLASGTDADAVRRE